MPDAAFDLALPVGIADATRQRRDAVVRQDVAIERIDGRIVDVRRQHAFTQVVEYQHAGRAAQATKRLLVQHGPDRRARLPREQVHRLARVAQGKDKQPRAPILPAARRAHHRALAVIDLRFFAGGRDDDDARLRRRRATHLSNEAPDARIAGREAVVVDQVLPDRAGVAPAAERLGDQLTVGRARTRTWRPRRGVGGHPRAGNGRLCDRFARDGRRIAPRSPAATHRDARGTQVAADGLAPHARGLLDAAQ